jgi:polar amino acid transport system substrate-binding protein
MKRREFLKTAAAGIGLGALGTGLRPANAQTPAASPAAGGDSLVDEVVKRGKLRVGVDLTFPPLQYRDPKTNEPKGYCVDVTKQLAKDLEVEVEWVEMPFGQLIPGLLAGRFDWSGIGLTIRPQRARSVRFVDEPLFKEDNILLLHRNTRIQDASELNRRNVVISNLAGSAQDATARGLFPNAQFRPLQQQEAMLEVASGRAQACLVAAWVAIPFAEKNRNVYIWSGGSLMEDINTFMLRHGDEKTAFWITNWMRYRGAHRLFQTAWDRHTGDLTAKLRQFSRRR